MYKNNDPASLRVRATDAGYRTPPRLMQLTKYVDVDGVNQAFPDAYDSGRPQVDPMFERCVHPNEPITGTDPCFDVMRKLDFDTKAYKYGG